MNYILLFSSILTLLISILLLVYYYNKTELYFIIGFIMILGSILAIYNHGTSSKFYKYIDRIFVLISLLYYLYIINIFYDNNYYYHIIIPVLFYISSKLHSNYYIRSFLHLFAHLTILYFHFIILLNIPT